MRTDSRLRRKDPLGPWGCRPLAALVGLIGLVTGAAAPEPAAAVMQARDSVRVTGVVDDVSTGGPVLAASLRLERADGGPIVASAESDADGAFTFSLVPRGDYVVHVDRLGYEPLDQRVSLIDPFVELFASMVPAALDLEPMVVTVGRRQSPQKQAFDERRVRGFGSFVTRDDIERWRPLRVTDALRSVPGVRVVPGRGSMDAGLLLRGRCRPAVYIDGIPNPPDLSLDLQLQPDDVEGIEVYSTATVPPQYAREACGVVLVWTREPAPFRGAPGWWKKLLVATTVMGVLITVG